MVKTKPNLKHKTIKVFLINFLNAYIFLKYLKKIKIIIETISYLYINKYWKERRTTYIDFYENISIIYFLSNNRFLDVINRIIQFN